MRITERGMYVLLEESRIRDGKGVATCPAGMEFNVVQLDLPNFKFYSPEMGDWQHYYFPARRKFSVGDRIRELHRRKMTDSVGTVTSVGDGTLVYIPDGNPPEEGRLIYDSDAFLLPNAPDQSAGGAGSTASPCWADSYQETKP